jgi:hypothetical protein
MRVQTPVRTLEVEGEDHVVTVYRHALSWAAFGKLQDQWQLDLTEVEKKLASPTYETVNDIMLATACEGGTVQSMADVLKLASQITPQDLLLFIQELNLAASPPITSAAPGEGKKKP